MRDVIEDYRKYLKEGEKAEVTISKYIRDVQKFMSFLQGRRLAKGEVLEYKAYLLGRYAPRSVNSAISSLNSFFEFMDRYDCKVKMIKIQKQIFSDKKRELSRKEYERLLTAAEKTKNYRLYYLMQTVCSTGIRISEDIYCKG